MPPKRRSAGPSTSLKRGNSSQNSNSQSQLSFNASKITKPHANTRKSTNGNSDAADDARARKAKEAGILAVIDSKTPTTQTTSESQSQTESQKTEDVKTPPTPPLSPQSSAALALPPSAINAHRATISNTASGPEIHTANLPLQEKILRHFDLSSKYGPCIGLSRKERWYRAQRLGLEPEIEVLRILLDLESGELKPELEEVEKEKKEKTGRGRKMKEVVVEEEVLEPARVGKRAYIEELMGGNGGVSDQ